MKSSVLRFALVLVVLTGTAVSADEAEVERATVTVADLGWLEGTWRGEAFGGIAEDIFDRPWDGSLVGTFKLSVNGKPKFYEFYAIVDTENGPEVRLKHFNPDMSGWEEKDDFVAFSFVSAGPNRIAFDGLSYELVGEDSLIVKVNLGKSEGEVETMTITYERVK